MSATTSIQWTDKTWNPVTGCTKVSPGCKNCYAEKVADRFWAGQYDAIEYQSYSVDACCPITEARPRRFTDVLTHDDRLGEPLRWKKPARVFVNSMSDLFHEAVPDDFIAEVWRVMSRTPRHTYQVLTKRAERLPELVPRLVATFGVLPNVWLGISAENQETLDQRYPFLAESPSAVRFLSLEPLLGEIDARRALRDSACDEWPCGATECAGHTFPPVDWVIVGGESGPHARPCWIEWIRFLLEQCMTADVPCFVKQLGSNRVIDHGKPAGPDAVRVIFQRDRKGGDPSEWPADLRVREWPLTEQTSAREVIP